MSCVGCETSLAPASPRMSKAELVDFDFERAPIYKSFVLDEERYKIGECIYVRGDDKAKSNEDWIAEILEIRAQDSRQVWIKVAWFYRPEDTKVKRKNTTILQGNSR
ncbi:hypothetical protein BC938DRAFT_483103 [Jimgerdemannia flammicorona]|uniref:BAH domain-containing protein n=1 Tax=Jimgerdemannia flammicorona TaxID=994334 RepID=A0A433QCP4_9FUNG|nr:hypothetical protein BC938DRAFT_483103 [Jimgerdemannia flammicorona]